jgi:Flp pilus assembly protein protease CpaA
VLLVLLSCALGIPALLMLAVLLLARLEASLLASAARRPAPGSAQNPRPRAAAVARPRARPIRMVPRPAPGPTLPSCRTAHRRLRRS